MQFTNRATGKEERGGEGRQVSGKFRQTSFGYIHSLLATELNSYKEKRIVDVDGSVFVNVFVCGSHYKFTSNNEGEARKREGYKSQVVALCFVAPTTQQQPFFYSLSHFTFFPSQTKIVSFVRNLPVPGTAHFFLSLSLSFSFSCSWSVRGAAEAPRRLRLSDGF